MLMVKRRYNHTKMTFTSYYCIIYLPYSITYSNIWIMELILLQFWIFILSSKALTAARLLFSALCSKLLMALQVPV
jgi:hypothetical protein